MDCRNVDARHYFLFGMRFYFGLWLLYAGLMKWVMFKPSGFVGFICSDFDKTWSPHALNTALAWLILFAEPILSLWILSGKKARTAWSVTSLFMFMLLIGQTMLMKPESVYNWGFTVLTLVCAALAVEPTAAVA